MQDGQYYLWIRRTYPDGTSGPNVIETLRHDDDGRTIVTFVSGSQVSIEIQG